MGEYEKRILRDILFVVTAVASSFVIKPETVIIILLALVLMKMRG